MNHARDKVLLFDTGRPKSAWALGLAGLFGFGAILGAYLVIRDRWILQIRPFDYPAIFGGILLLGFALVLSYIFLQTFQRTRIEVSADSLSWHTSGPLGNSASSVAASDARCFQVRGSDIMFHVKLELASTETVSLLSSVSARRWKECAAVLREFLPNDPSLQDVPIK